MTLLDHAVLGCSGSIWEMEAAIQVTPAASEGTIRHLQAPKVYARHDDEARENTRQMHARIADELGRIASRPLGSSGAKTVSLGHVLASYGSASAVSSF